MDTRGKRTYAGALAAAAILTIGLPLAANADTVQVLELGGTNQTLTFKGTGSSSVDLLQLGTCSGGVCTWTEAGPGSTSNGVNQLAGYHGLWSLSTPYGQSTFNITLASGFGGSSNDWGVTQPGPLTFNWGTAGCSGASCYLTGDLELTDILQSGQGGIFNLGLDANLTITGGSLAYLVGSNGTYDYTIDFSSRTGLNQLTDGRTLTATGSSGEVLASTPEPNSEVLLASGLGALLIGSFFKRRLQKAS
ncbi:MAG TPA: hypothetical protein VMT20_30080 [Terriglobia bacterium]|nr:hypothetical protein [Terriglobia bacterium]